MSKVNEAQLSSSASAGGDPFQLYQSSKEFLQQVTLSVDTQDSIYKLVDSHLFATNTVEDEYTIVVLRIMNTDLYKFYGGEYIVQQWYKKKKLFQAVHNSLPNHFFLHRQRFIYSLKGNTEESQWLYIVTFYQEVFQKIRHPLFDLNNHNGNHEIALYVDAKQMMVISGRRIMWASFKSDEKQISSLFGAVQATRGIPTSSQQVDSAAGGTLNQSDTSFTRPNYLLSAFSERVENKTRFVKPQILTQQFKNVLTNAQFESSSRGGRQQDDDDDEFQFIQLLDIGNEGLNRKEIHLVIEVADKIVICGIKPIKLKDIWIFKISEKQKFNKTNLDLQFQEKIQTVQIINIGDSENIYMMTKEDGQLRLITIKDLEDSIFSFASIRNSRVESRVEKLENTNPDKTQQTVQGKAPKEEELEEVQEGGIYSHEDEKVYAKNIFLRRTFIYIEEHSGQIKRLKIQDCKVSHPFKKCDIQSRPKAEVMIQDINNHLAFFTDYILANTALILGHGKILSIYNFKTYQWNHIIPEQEDADSNNQSYFGMPDDEIKSLTLNYIFPNSIYDCIVQYYGLYLRRLKYYNEINKTFFEKRITFKDEQVKQIIRNFDLAIFRKYGETVARTFFLIKEKNSKGMLQVWVCENGGKITKFIQNMSDKWSLLNVTNAPTDLLVIYQADKKKLVFYSIPNVQQTLNGSELIDSPYQLNEISNFSLSDQTKYFFFKGTLFYTMEGNLYSQKLESDEQEQEKSIIHHRMEYNFKNGIKELYMSNKDSVYYKDKKNVFRYANLSIQNSFDLDQLPSKVLRCFGAFVQKIDFCIHSNRLALFTSPFEIAIIPNLNKCSIDLMATMNFEENFLFWRQKDNIISAFKEPNVVITWNVDTGKVIRTAIQKQLSVKGFKKHSDWNGTTLLKQQKESTYDQPEKQDKLFTEGEQTTPGNDFSSFTKGEKGDIESIMKAQHPNKHLFAQWSIDDEGQAQEVCRFLYDYKQGLNLYVSYPYMVAMDDNCTKMYQLESKGAGNFKTLKHVSTFYEIQMRVGKPIYFSPDLMHRLFIDTETNKIILNFTLTNQDLVAIPVDKKKLMYQVKKTHPMIYFHDNDKIVYVTNAGVEKVLQIEKVVGKWRKKATVTLKEISYCYYNQIPFVRRFVVDQLNVDKQLVTSLDPLTMLRIKYDLLRRNILLHEYLVTNKEDETKSMKREYQDKNVGDFSNLIIGNFRRQMSFSYLSWKVIEEVKAGNLSLLDFRKEFIHELGFTILPDQTTILHHLNDNFEELQNFIKILGDKAHGNASEKHDEKLITFNEVPFIPNLNGLTPLHISIDKNNTRFTDKIVNCLATTDFDHHIRFIIHKFHELINQVPEALKYYLESRQKVPVWIENYTRGKIVTHPDCEFMMASNNLWDNQINEKLETSLFKGDLDLPLKMFIIDLPNFQKYEDKDAYILMKEMSETDNIQLFEPASIRAIVELKWPKVYKAMNKYLFMPYLVLLFSFLIYSVYIFENLQQGKVLAEQQEGNSTTVLDIGWDLRNPQFWVINQKHIIKLVILALASYFFTLEFRQFVVQGPVKYFTSPWNLIDMIPLTLITLSLLLEYFVDFPQTERAINSVSSFFLWLKFLYFLRMNRRSSKFISLIVAVIGDMKVFLLVLFVGMVSFSQSMFILSNNNAPEDRFISSMAGSLLFTYEIALGSWDVTKLGKTDQFLIMSLFVISTLFLQVIMLNMLIAVVSDTYAMVEESSTNQVYKNMADLIVENEYLVPGGEIVDHDQIGNYLYIAKIDEALAKNDQLNMKLQRLKKVIKARTNEVSQVAQDITQELNQVIHLNTEKFVTTYIEESLKNELKFKSEVRKHGLERINPGQRTFSELELKEEDQKHKSMQSPKRSPQKAKPAVFKSEIFTVKEEDEYK